jgi:tetratricopeptide (TPR) repeat protein
MKSIGLSRVRYSRVGPRIRNRSSVAVTFLVAVGLFGLAAGVGPTPVAAGDSSDVNTYLQQGLQAFRKGRLKEAAEAYQKAAALDPANPVPYKNLGITYVLMKHYREAIDPFEKAVALRPSSAAYHYYLARAYQLAKNYPKAIEIFQGTIELDPRNAKAHMRLGELYGREQERLPEAIEMLKRSIALEPNLSEAHYSLAVAYFGVKNYAKSWKSLREAQRLEYAQIKPEFIKALRKMAPEPK